MVTLIINFFPVPKLLLGLKPVHQISCRKIYTVFYFWKCIEIDRKRDWIARWNFQIHSQFLFFLDKFMCSYMLDEKLTTIYQKENVHFFLCWYITFYFCYGNSKKKDIQFLCEWQSKWQEINWPHHLNVIALLWRGERERKILVNAFYLA